MQRCKLHIVIAALGFVLASCGQKHHGATVDQSDPNLTLENGVLELEGTPFTGRLVAYHSQGELAYEATYSDGRKNGIERKWYTGNVLREEREYREGVKYGIHRGWWENGQIQFRYEFNGDGLYEGARCEWYQNGQLFRDFNYVNGQESGSQRLWTTDGKIRGNYEVVGGERFGLIGLKKCFTVTKDKNEIL